MALSLLGSFRSKFRPPSPRKEYSDSFPNGYSIVSFVNRSAEDKAHGIRRAYEEPTESRYLGTGADPFTTDCKRIVSSREYQRLAAISQFDTKKGHELKSRMTHTTNVQHIADEIAKALNLDDQSIKLIHAITYAHDIGHMPFNHWGERAARTMLKKFGKDWNHDTAGLNIVTQWTNGGISHPGMNLTLDTVEGLTKRYWRYDGDTEKRDHFTHHPSELPETIRTIDAELTLNLKKYNHIEGQIAAISDWIAFTASDIRDGLHLRTIDMSEVRKEFPQADQAYKELMEAMRHSIKHNRVTDTDHVAGRSPHKRERDARVDVMTKLMAERLAQMMVQDVIKQTNENIRNAVKTGTLKKADDVRNLDHLLVKFSPEMEQGVRAFGRYCKKKPFTTTLWPYEEMVKNTISDIVSGALPLHDDWQKDHVRASAITDDNQRKAALTELACRYMTCIMDDDDVMNHYLKTHPQEEARHAAHQPTTTAAGISRLKGRLRPPPPTVYTGRA